MQLVMIAPTEVSSNGGNLIKLTALFTPHRTSFQFSQQILAQTTVDGDTADDVSFSQQTTNTSADVWPPPYDSRSIDFISVCLGLGLVAEGRGSHFIQ